jgi:hypothetical protein
MEVDTNLATLLVMGVWCYLAGIITVIVVIAGLLRR